MRIKMNPKINNMKITAVDSKVKDTQAREVVTDHSVVSSVNKKHTQVLTVSL